MFAPQYDLFDIFWHLLIIVIAADHFVKYANQVINILLDVFFVCFETFKNAKPAKGYKRVFIPGEIEREKEIEIRKSGLNIIPAVKNELIEIAKELKIDFE